MGGVWGGCPGGGDEGGRLSPLKCVGWKEDPLLVSEKQPVEIQTATGQVKVEGGEGGDAQVQISSQPRFRGSR